MLKNFTVIPVETIRDEELKSSEKLVYLYLMGLSGFDGACFPSISTMCRELNLSRQTVCNSVKALQKKKKISYLKRNNSKGASMSNYYLVTNRCYDMTNEAVEELKKLYLSGLINTPDAVIIGSGDCDAENQGSDNC